MMRDKNRYLPTFLHWFSWTISLTASSFFLVDMIREGIPDLMSGKDVGIKYILLILLLAIAGCLVSLFKQKVGAIMMLAGGVLLIAILYLQVGIAGFGMMVVYGLSYIFPALVLILLKK